MAHLTYDPHRRPGSPSHLQLSRPSSLTCHKERQTVAERLLPSLPFHLGPYHAPGPWLSLPFLSLYDQSWHLAAQQQSRGEDAKEEQAQRALQISRLGLA